MQRTIRMSGIAGLLVLATGMVTTTVAAQGAYGRPRGSRGSPEIATGDARRPNPGEPIAERMLEMAVLKPVLRGVDVPRAMRDSMGKIEEHYRELFTSYGKFAKDQFTNGLRPDSSELRRLFRDADLLREEEWTAAKALLPADQAAKVDANIVTLKAEELRQNAEMRARIERDAAEAGPAAPRRTPPRPPQA